MSTSRAVRPLHTFPDVAEFARRHKAGTEAEFAATEKLVKELNKQATKFQAWFVSRTRQTAKRSEFLVLVQPGLDGERKLPQQNEPARLRVVFGAEDTTRHWEARRIENPAASMKINARCPDKLAAFHVTVHISEAHKSVVPLVDAAGCPHQKTGTDVVAQGYTSSASHFGTSSSSRPDDRSSDSVADYDSSPTSPEPSDVAAEINLTDDNAVHVNFLLTASEATKNAELTALESLCGKHINATERQIKAFEYFVLLRDPDFVVDNHYEMPHLKAALQDPKWHQSPLGKQFALLNPQQKAAYLKGFDNMPCGICVLPGGPGAGKTHFNLFTIAMAQSKPLPRPLRIRPGQYETRSAKVLFIVDMNSPVDDVANRMVRLYAELGMKKSIIRMKGWGAEVKLSDRLNAAEDAASGDPLLVDFSHQFLRTANLMGLGRGPKSGRACKAPSLDEAAWQRYDEYKGTKYEELTKYMKEELWENNEVLPLRFRRLVYNLYRDTLAHADFIATTPVAASSHFRGMFKPDLVYFDESPHARELSNLIAIANFDPIAWVFCGDYRQTVPYVGSATADCENIYREQMQVSMMERAAKAGVIRYELLMNHRSFGGLHQLASALWYDGRMVSGTDHRIPAALPHIQNYLERFTGGQRCTVPRLLVHVKDCGPEGRDGTSAWNPTHTAWVMARVRELLSDAKFKHADRDEPGTILIISPYKKAFNEYKNAIKQLPQWAQHRVETRTVDVVQGHEADFVFLDLVKEQSTRFLDNPNRLCVAVTRARLGEIIMMHPKMVQSTTFLRNSQNLRPIYNHCKAAGQVVVVDPEPNTSIVANHGASNMPPSKSAAAAAPTVPQPTSSPVANHEAGKVAPNEGVASTVSQSTASPTVNNVSDQVPSNQRVAPPAAPQYRKMDAVEAATQVKSPSPNAQQHQTRQASKPAASSIEEKKGVVSVLTSIPAKIGIPKTEQRPLGSTLALLSTMFAKKL